MGIAYSWCERRDLNPYESPHTPLKRARLPIPPLSRQPAGFEQTEKFESVACFSYRVFHIFLMKKNQILHRFFLVIYHFSVNADCYNLPR